MRQQQNNQNRRMRGRGPGGGNSGNGGGGNSGGGNNNNNNNRKGPNPLTRSYESNGPDVKVRGTAQHVAEKYMTLARDAQSSGDRVMAENYLQHAEHYNRIIAAAYAANPPQLQQNQNDGDEDNSMDGDSRFHSNPMPGSDNNTQQPYDGNAPQPVIEGVPAEVALGEANVPRPQSDAEDQERRPSRNRRPRGPRAPREDGDQPSGGEDALSALPDFIVQRAPAQEPVTADE
jgi:Domain of unknown function (DUF4167)